MNVQEYYQHALTERGFQADAAQQRAVDRLQEAYDEWVAYKSQRSSAFRRLINRPDVPQGVYMWGGVCIGLVAAVVCYGAVALKNVLGYDDSLDAFGVHGVGGFVGAVLTGVFCSAMIDLKGGKISRQVVVQAWDG